MGIVDLQLLAERFIYAWVLIVNVAAFVLIWLDKRKAIRGKNRNRVSEKTFFVLSFLGGAIGVMMGMRLFRHKTRHPSFKFGIPLLILLNTAMFFYLFYLLK